MQPTYAVTVMYQTEESTHQLKFQLSGGAEAKHRKNESSIRAVAASHMRSEVLKS